MTNIILIALLIQPWFFIPLPNIIDQFRVPQGLILDSMFMGIIAYSFFNGNKLLYRNKYLSYLMGWVFISILYYFFFPFSLDVIVVGRMVNLIMLEPMLHIFLGIWALQCVLSTLEKEDFIRIAKVLCFSSFLVGSFALLQKFGFDPLKCIGAKYIMQNRVSTCLGNPNLVGGYLALCLPLFFMFKQPKYAFGALITLLGIAVSNCHFGVFLGILGVMIFLFVKYRKNIITWILTALLIIGGLFMIIHYDYAKTANGIEGRIPAWEIGVEKLKDNVLFGQGLGIWKSYNVEINLTKYTMAHNDWLERTIELGLIGLVLMLLVVINTFRNFSYEGDDNYAYLSMFTIFLVMMMGSFPFEAPSLAALGFVSFAAMEKM